MTARTVSVCTLRALAAALAGCCALAASAQGATVHPRTYPLPANSSPREAVEGPDGALWITFSGTNEIARMDVATLAVTTFPIPTPNSGADQITAGPDGNLWFTEIGASRIGRVTTAGVVTEFPTPTANANPQGITGGPDGNVWFNEVGPAPQRVARITPAGAITEFPVPGGIATDLTAGPDGNIWYTGSTDNVVGRMTPAGAANEFFAPGTPTGIVTADATSLWYTQGTGAAIGRITTAGVTTSHTALPTSSASNAIVAGHDGNAWFTESAAGRVGFINASNPGTTTDFALGATQLGGLTAGSDGAIWIPEPSTSSIVRVDTTVSTPGPPPPPALGKSMGGQTISGTVLVKLPGSGRFVKLTAGKSLPLGTIVDARRGTVRIFATSGGTIYSADFYQGQFQIAQRKIKGATADMRLFGGSFRRCPAGLRNPKSLGASGPKSVRHLWGKGSGKFRTAGRFSAAAVRGTTWLTDDQCTGTLTRVTAGSVSVRDFVRRRTVLVKAGHRYFAKARG